MSLISHPSSIGSPTNCRTIWDKIRLNSAVLGQTSRTCFYKGRKPWTRLIAQMSEIEDMWSSKLRYVNVETVHGVDSEFKDNQLGLSDSLFEDASLLQVEVEEPAEYMPPPPISETGDIYWKQNSPLYLWLKQTPFAPENNHLFASMCSKLTHASVFRLHDCHLEGHADQNFNIKLQNVLYTLRDVLPGPVKKSGMEELSAASMLIHDDVMVEDPLIRINGKERLSLWLHKLVDLDVVVDLHEIYTESSIGFPRKGCVHAIWTLTFPEQQNESSAACSKNEIKIKLSGESKIDVCSDGLVISVRSKWYVKEERMKEILEEYFGDSWL